MVEWLWSQIRHPLRAGMLTVGLAFNDMTLAPRIDAAMSAGGGQE